MTDPTQPVDHSGIAAITGGDPDRVKRLRATLAVVARRTDDPEFRSLIAEVLAGRAPVRRALTHPTMFAMAQTSLDNLEEGLERLDDDERAEVMDRIGEERTPDEVIEEMREPTPVSDGSQGVGEHDGGEPHQKPPSEGTW